METQKERVAKLLKSRKWFPATEINKVAGSDHGTRRVRELREDGYEIKVRRTAQGTQYRIADTP